MAIDERGSAYVRDTIAAIATPPGRGGIGVIRISGDQVQALATALLGNLPKARFASHRSFLDASGNFIDDGIALYFPGPHSFTGEDVLELQGHGGPVVLHMLLSRCLELGARIAEPGEFTQRAYLNDKLDLAQAEAVADLIDASTQQAARSAVRSLTGEFSRHIHALAGELVDLRMYVEATLDFPEEDIEFIESGRILIRLQKVVDQLSIVQRSARQGALLREGLRVVLVGQPNVGKSSLLNCLAGEDLAIVTDIPGTTRDAIRQVIQIDGVPLHIVDTAGLRNSTDVVEQLGMERTWQAIDQADLILLLSDARLEKNAEDLAILQRMPEKLPLIHVRNKMDLLGDKSIVSTNDHEYLVSAKTGAGLDKLRLALLREAGWEGRSEGLFLARTRHLDALRCTEQHLKIAMEIRRQIELLAEELRLAHDALMSITGEFTPDDLLGEIFSRFCIGK